MEFQKDFFFFFWRDGDKGVRRGEGEGGVHEDRCVREDNGAQVGEICARARERNAKSCGSTKHYLYVCKRWGLLHIDYSIVLYNGSPEMPYHYPFPNSRSRQS